jgi:hypothetical protein
MSDHSGFRKSQDALALAVLVAGLLHSTTLVLASTNNSAGDIGVFRVYIQFERRCEWGPKIEHCDWVKTGIKIAPRR